MMFSSAAVPPGFRFFTGTPGAPVGPFSRGESVPADAERTAGGSGRIEDGLEFLRRAALRGLGAPVTPPGPLETPRLPSARETADEILGFVRARLQREAADGASQDRLDGLLAAAREGFERGYQQALADLDALGRLDDELAGELNGTRDLVLSGLDDLAALPTLPASGISRFESYQRAVRTQQSETLQLEVRTRDGDRVRIQFESLDAYRSESSVVRGSGEGGSFLQAEFNETRLSSERFSVRVQGDLDEEEQAALQELLGRVDRLADEFFEGDAQLALEQALELGYDRDEIAGFSLRLTATDVRQVTETYRRVSEFGDGGQPVRGGVSDLAQTLRPLGQFLQSVRAAEDAAQALEQPGRLLRQLLEAGIGLLAQDDPLRGAERLLLDLLGDGEEAGEDRDNVAEAA